MGGRLIDWSRGGGEGRGGEGRGGEGYTKAVYQNIDWSHYTEPSVGRAYHLVVYYNEGIMYGCGHSIVYNDTRMWGYPVSQTTAHRN